jgi:transposase
VEKRRTYRQDWPNYNRAQTTEKRWFLTLLADLCQSIPDPARKPTRGQQPVKLADAIFASCFKVYSGFSARRFTCDLEDAAEAGHISKPLHFNTVLKTFDSEATTGILKDLITRSASPLRTIETDFAVDSSGFSGCRFLRWHDEKYGMPRRTTTWAKSHIVCGVKTNVIAAAEVLDKDSGDSPQLTGLVETVAKSFTVSEVAADKAYASQENFNAVDKLGGTLYAAFKSNTTGGVGGLYAKMFHLFSLEREAYLAHYHKRSNVESTFAMVKRKFGDSVKAKTDLAMRNEVYAKFVCHNIACVVSAIYERGINPVFVGLPNTAEHGDELGIIRFPGL